MYGDFASTIRAKASATRSRRASSARSTRSAGSRCDDVGLVQRGPEGAVVLEARRPHRPARARTTCRGARAPPRRRRPRRPATRRPPSSGPGTSRARAAEMSSPRQPARVAGRRPSARRAGGWRRPACSSRSIARAMSAPRSQRSCPSSRAPSAPMTTKARRWRARCSSGAPGAMVRRQGAQRLHRLVGIEEPALALDLQVVAAEEQGEDAGGVRRAAGVLEHRRRSRGSRALLERQPQPAAPSSIAIRHVRSAWPMGCPSVRSSANESAATISDRRMSIRPPPPGR